MRDMPPDSKGSGASPAEPDQPTQAPPRPATKGSSAVTRPPGLRCHRTLPSGSVTWSTGSRLATTTTGLSAPVCCCFLDAPMPAPTLLSAGPDRPAGPSIAGGDRAIGGGAVLRPGAGVEPTGGEAGQLERQQVVAGRDAGAAVADDRRPVGDAERREAAAQLLGREEPAV